MRRSDVVVLALVLALIVAVARLHRFYCRPAEAREIEPSVVAKEFVEIQDSPEIRFFRVAMRLKQGVSRKLPLVEYQALMTAAGEAVVVAAEEKDDLAFARSVGEFLRSYYTTQPVNDDGEPLRTEGDLESLSAFLGSNPDDLMDRITDLYYRRDTADAFFYALEKE